MNHGKRASSMNIKLFHLPKLFCTCKEHQKQKKIWKRYKWITYSRWGGNGYSTPSLAAIGSSAKTDPGFELLPISLIKVASFVLDVDCLKSFIPWASVCSACLLALRTDKTLPRNLSLTYHEQTKIQWLYQYYWIKFDQLRYMLRFRQTGTNSTSFFFKQEREKISKKRYLPI